MKRFSLIAAQQVGHAGGAPHLVTASLDGTIAVCGGSTKGTRGSIGGVILQRMQVGGIGVIRAPHYLAVQNGQGFRNVSWTPCVIHRFHRCTAIDIGETAA